MTSEHADSSTESAPQSGNAFTVSDIEKLTQLSDEYFRRAKESVLGYGTTGMLNTTHRMTRQEIADFRKEANLIWIANPLPDGSRRHVDRIYAKTRFC